MQLSSSWFIIPPYVHFARTVLTSPHSSLSSIRGRTRRPDSAEMPGFSCPFVPSCEPPVNPQLTSTLKQSVPVGMLGSNASYSHSHIVTCTRAACNYGTYDSNNDLVWSMNGQYLVKCPIFVLPSLPTSCCCSQCCLYFVDTWSYWLSVK